MIEKVSRRNIVIDEILNTSIGYRYEVMKQESNESAAEL